MLFPSLWVMVVVPIGAISAIHHRRLQADPDGSAAVFYLLLSYADLAVHGLAGLLTGREPEARQAGEVRPCGGLTSATSASAPG